MWGATGNIHTDGCGNGACAISYLYVQWAETMEQTNYLDAYAHTIMRLWRDVGKWNLRKFVCS